MGIVSFLYGVSGKKGKDNVGFEGLELADVKVEIFLKEWCESFDIKPEYISKTFEKLGYALPIKVLYIHTTHSSNFASCIDVGGVEFRVSFGYSKNINGIPTISIGRMLENYYEINEYEIIIDREDISRSKEILVTRQLERNHKTILTAKYYADSCSRTLFVDNEHSLELDYSKPGYDCNSRQERYSDNYYIIEDYLVRYSFDDIKIDEIYESILKIIDIRATEMDEFNLNYNERGYDTNISIAGITVKNGHVSSYGYFTEDGESIMANSVGDWHFYSKQITMEYSKEVDTIEVKMLGSLESVAEVNLQEVIKNVQEELDIIRAKLK